MGWFCGAALGQTWTGNGGDAKASNAANWDAPLATDGTGNTATALVFPGGVANTVVDVDLPYLAIISGGTMTITADAPSYTFTSSGFVSGSGNGLGLQATSGTSTPASLINNSPNTQTFAGGFYGYRGTIINNGGDILFTPTAEINPGSNSTATGRWLSIDGPGNYHLNAPFFHATATNNTTTTARGGDFYISGGGNVYLGDLGTQYNGSIIIDSAAGGKVFPQHVNAFASNDNGRTRIAGGTTANGRLVLAPGYVPTAEVINVIGRSGAGTNEFMPHIQNLSGTNEINSFIQNFNAGSAGSNVNIDVAAGTLRIGAIIQNPQSTRRTLRLTAAAGANGEIYDVSTEPGEERGGIIQGSSAARTWDVVIAGDGVWTNNSVQNFYAGSTTVAAGATYVFNGVHRVDDTGIYIATPYVYTIADYTVNGTLDISGQINSSLVLNGALKLGPAPRTLNLPGLTVNDGAVLNFRLESTDSTTDDLIAVAGPVNFSAATAVTINLTSLSGPSLPNGDYPLITGASLVQPAGGFAATVTGSLAPGQNAGLVFDTDNDVVLLRLGGVIPPIPTPVWTGGGADDNLATAGNWIDGLTPDLSPGSTVAFVFPNPTGPHVTPTLTADAGSRSISFTDDAPAYTFTGPGFVLDVGNGGGANAIVNNSPATQVFNVGVMRPHDGNLLPIGGDVVINAAMDLSAGSLTLTGGGHDVYLNVDSSIHPAGNVNAGAFTGGFQDGRITQNGTGRLYLGDCGLESEHPVIVNSGFVRVTHPNALGKPMAYSSAGPMALQGRTQIAGGSSDGAVEFAGGVTLATPLIDDPDDDPDAGPYVHGERFNWIGRSSDAYPHLINLDGVNVLPAPVGFTAGGGTATTNRYCTIESRAGKLVFGDGLAQTQNHTKTLAIRGDGDVEFQNGILCGGSPTPSNTRTWELHKSGTGTLILSGPTTSDYNGSTTIEGGTLLMLSSYQPRDGALKDWTVAVGGKLAGTGTIDSNVIVEGTVAPGTADAPGTLTLGMLTIHDGGTFNYRLETPASFTDDFIELTGAAGTLDLSANPTVNLNVTSLSGPALAQGEYPLVRYQTLVPPTAPLGLNYTGPLADGQAAELRIDAANRLLSLRIGPPTTPEPPTLPPDFNTDGDVDFDDFSILAACLSGSKIPAAPECSDRDLDGDGDVDQVEFGLWQRCFSGQNVQAEIPRCTLTTR
ncbi:MAG: autotransporter-associated beta strand repeat-containing protein [Phycisphaerae bacterium]|jgi:autotransporter-associated beta strand protein